MTFEWEGVRDAFEGTSRCSSSTTRAVFKKYGLSFPSTWTALLSDIKTFNSDSVIPDRPGQRGQLGRSDVPRVPDGPHRRAAGLFESREAGDKGAWNEPAIQKALADIQTLVKDKAFNVGYDSVSWTHRRHCALLYSGKAAMQLMGVWDVSSYLFE